MYERPSRVELGNVERMSVSGIDAVKLELGEKEGEEVSEVKLELAPSEKPDESAKSSESEAIKSEVLLEAKSLGEIADQPKASGRFEIGNALQAEKEEGGQLELSLKGERDSSLGGFSIGAGAAIDDDEDDDEKEAAGKSHAGLIAAIVILVLGGVVAGYAFLGEKLGLPAISELTGSSSGSSSVNFLRRWQEK